MRTLYLIDRVVLGERRLPCRRGLVFVTDEDGGSWHAVIYDPAFEVLATFERNEAVPFGATTPEGLWLEGIAKPGCADHETRSHYLHGLGRLKVSGESAHTLPSAVSGTAAARARRAV